MKKYLLLLALCSWFMLVKAQTADTAKNGPPLPLNGADPDNSSPNKISPDNSDNEKVFTHVTGPPQFPGGDDSLRRYLDKQITYPPNLLKKHIGGRVVVSFVVEKDGSLSQLKVQFSPNQLFNAEVLRAIQPLKYIPGNQNGHVLRVAYSAIIHFDPDYPAFH